MPLNFSIHVKQSDTVQPGVDFHIMLCKLFLSMHLQIVCPLLHQLEPFGNNYSPAVNHPLACSGQWIALLLSSNKTDLLTFELLFSLCSL